MAIRVIPDHDKPSVAIEISLSQPLPDYDLDQMEQPAPRDIDAILVTQGFRDLVDDARGVLLDILCQHPRSLLDQSSKLTDLGLSPAPSLFHPMEIAQLTGAICPGDDEIFRPGLWIVLHDPHAPANQPLSPAVLDHVKEYINALVKRLSLA